MSIAENDPSDTLAIQFDGLIGLIRAIPQAMAKIDARLSRRVPLTEAGCALVDLEDALSHSLEQVKAMRSTVDDALALRHISEIVAPVVENIRAMYEAAGCGEPNPASTVVTGPWTPRDPQPPCAA